jgi:hypothetical protein
LLAVENACPCPAYIPSIEQLQLVAVDHGTEPTGGDHLVPEFATPNYEDPLLRPAAQLEISKDS